MYKANFLKAVPWRPLLDRPTFGAALGSAACKVDFVALPKQMKRDTEAANHVGTSTNDSRNSQRTKQINRFWDLKVVLKIQWPRYRPLLVQ